MAKALIGYLNSDLRDPRSDRRERSAADARGRAGGPRPPLSARRTTGWSPARAAELLDTPPMQEMQPA